MSDTPTVLAVIEPDAIIHPVATSADGLRNSFSSRCAVTEQVMNYAACQWRQRVIGAQPSVNTPADWAPCIQAAKSNRCQANTMLQEEQLAGKAIFFVERFNVRTAANAARRWGEKAVSTLKNLPASIKTAPVAKPADILDSMGDTGDYADAITAAVAETPAAAPVAVVVPKLTPTPMPVALPGESPLAMARRLHAEKVARG